MYKEIILAIAEYFKQNKCYIKEKLVSHYDSHYYEDTWHGVSFEYETENVSKFNILISPFIDCKDTSNPFLEIEPIYKDNHEEESFLYKNFQFPTSLSEVPDFCEKLINTHIPEILENKNIFSLGDVPTKMPL